MRTTRSLCFAGLVAIGIAGYLITTRTRLNAQQNAPVKIKPDDIGGVVSSTKGPEAGVWVIAETTDLPTRYIKEVVTDDRGPLPDPRSSQGQVHRLGARLRPGGFAQSRRPSPASWSI